MKYLFTTALTFISILSFGQFNCIDGEVWSCNGFVDDANIYGNLDFSDNSITSYTCDGSTIGFSLGTGLNDLYGQDDIYIFNSIGESGELNSMTVTLTMDSNTDLDMIAISSDCSYNCFASDSYTFSGTGVTESFTLEWEDEETIILVVEAYHLDGGGDYQLNFQYNNLYNFCSYFPYEGTPITCSPSNQYSGSLFPVNCITSFPTDCPPEITYHEGEGPYFANEQVYTFIPEASSGVINIDLSLSSGMKAYLYHKYFGGFDYTPINLIGSGSSFISASYTLNGFDEFYLIIDGPDQGVYPYSFSIEFPGCNPIDECGDCFSYTEIGNGKCKIDNSLTPNCGNEQWTYSNWPNGGNNTSFTLNNNNEVQFPIAGDYLVCYTHFCDDLPTLAINNNESQIGKTCCIVVSIGESCSEPPIAHFTGSPNVQSSTGHINFFNSNTSLNADSYSWHWGDGSTNSTSQTNISHDYAIEPNPVNLCMVASNECGMSKYCISYDT